MSDSISKAPVLTKARTMKIMTWILRSLWWS